MNKNEYYPNVAQSLWILIKFAFLYPMLIVILLYILSSIFGFHINTLTLQAQDIIDIIGALLIIRYIKKKYIFNFQELFTLKNFHLKYLLPMILIILGVIIAMSDLENFIANHVSNHWIKLLEGAFSNSSFAETIISTVVIAPIVEEFIMRGIILRGLLKHYKKWAAIIISAALFALLHMNPIQIVAPFTIGIIFGWWYSEMKSIIPCIIGHMVNNFLAIMSGYIPVLNDVSSKYQPLWLDAFGVVIFLVGIFLLRKMFKEENNVLV